MSTLRAAADRARPDSLPVINEDVYVELLELLEMYCELLISRFGLLDQRSVRVRPASSVH